MQLSKSFTILALGLTLSVLALGASPKLINFQGILRKAGGQPVTDSTYSVSFKVYDSPTGGTLLWSESQSVTTTGGLFTVLLGTVTPVPDSGFNDTGRYLGITISPDPEMTPREELVSIPYGYRVNSVDGALGGLILTKVTIGPGQTNTGLNAFVTGSDNTVSGDSSTVGGGSRNTASNTSATVVGGYANLASGQFSAVGGGRSDTASTIGSVVSGGSYNTASSEHGVVGGGYANQAAGPWNTTVGGGSYNVASGNHATIGGGKGNRATGWFSVVGGGGSDASGDSNTASAFWSTVSGGLGNKATGQAGTVAGGAGNTTSGLEATTGGGKSNTASSSWATVGGGRGDTASGLNGTVGGGDHNIANGTASVIGGGSNNRATTTSASVAGGQSNMASNAWAFVGGGANDTASGQHAMVGGGDHNIATAEAATVSGGHTNTAISAYAAVGGGSANSASGSYSTVSGGQLGTAGGVLSTIGGGNNNVASGLSATVGGGNFNRARGLSSVVCGGGGATSADSNLALGSNSVVGGGSSNVANGANATVPGGLSNSAVGNFTFAAGRRAKANHLGSFVWADSSVDADFTSTANNQFLIRAAGGVGIGTNSPAARLHVDSGDVFIGSVATATSPGTNLYIGDVGSDANNTFRMDAFNNDFYIVARSGSGAAAGTTIRFRTAAAGLGEFDRMRITAAGNVGIGTTAPTSLLSVNGAASNTTGVWAIFSDRRLKRDIEPINGALETVARLKGVSFRWRDADKDAQFGRVRGLIAQDVEEVLPEWVKTDPDGYKRIEPIGVDALLIEAIKTLKTENAGLQDRIAKLESTVNSLLARSEETQATRSAGDRTTGGR